MASGMQVWSGTASVNSTIDTNINWAEGMAPSQVNDSARAGMASAANWVSDNNGTLVTAGSSTAFTVTTNQVAAALTAGYTVTVQFHANVEAGATLAQDGLAAKNIQSVPGTNVVANEFLTGTIRELTYLTSGSGAWVARGAQRTLNSVTAQSSATTAISTSAWTDSAASANCGSTGVWYAVASAAMGASGGHAFNMAYRLWDGTTIMNTLPAGYGQGNAALPTTSAPATVTLAGVITNPAGNVRLSAQALTGSAAVSFIGTDASTLTTAGQNITCIRIG